MILIITSKTDGHIEAVSRHFDAAGIEWVRVNTEDFARNVELTIIPTTGDGHLLIRDSDKRVELKRVTAVWYRKPEPVDLSYFALDRSALDYIEAEFNEIILGLYALLSHVLWINNPFTTRIAHRKLLQLRVATQVGFKTPRTIVTNDTETALRFADEINADLAIKSLGALCVTHETGNQAVQYGIFTRRITRRELEDTKDKVGAMPTLFQEFVEKRCELRITCVGKRVLVCRIEPRDGDVTADDYRFDTKSLKHTVDECPELHQKLHAYMEAFGLNFACFDIIVTKAGEAVFLECNANGQWHWVEAITRLPIGHAIAEELMSASQGATWGESDRVPLEQAPPSVKPRAFSIERVWGGGGQGRKLHLETKKCD